MNPMKTLVALVSLLLVGSAPAQAAEGSAPTRTAVPPDDARIAYMGRLEQSAQKAQMGFPGVTIRFAYRGPAPVIKMTGDNANCFFNLACNGWDPVVIHLKPGANEFPLPAGVAPAAGWVVELVRRTESWMGTASFDGLILPDGCELLPPPAWPARKLMFIGDSLTCGEYDERFPPEDDSTPRSTNVARSYGMLLAKWLTAQVHVVAYGGRGLVRNWDGRRNVNVVPVFFERALPDDPNSRWDHARYQPDVIVINDGTDHDKDIMPEAELTAAYAAFVARVREVYPAAWILITESGFHADAASGRPTKMREEMWKTLEAVVARRHASGDDRVRAVRCRFFPGTATDPHLVAFQQEQIALDLLGPIKEAMGW
jgi:hypothetical protein